MLGQRKQFDFTRNDKLFELTIPKYQHIKDSVYYEIHLRDLVKNQTYVHMFRFNQLKAYHEYLQELKLQLPQFPKTHFWKKTNKNPQMIKQRKTVLERYFNIMVNEPFTRGTKYIKRFINVCKYGDRSRRYYSNDRKYTKATRAQTSRPNSLRKFNSELQIDVVNWKK